MEKVTRNNLTKREIEIMILGEIATQTNKRYNESKNYIMQTFAKENIEKIANEKGSFTKVNAMTNTIENIINDKKAQIEKLQKEIEYLNTLDKHQVMITRNEYATRSASKETKEKAQEYIQKMLADFTSKTLKQ